MRLPNASFIGFTGTPIELTDKNTRAVFGDYISIYDIQRAVEDKATVPIYYESRLAKLELKPDERPKLDEQFEEVTEGEEEVKKEKLKTKWAALEALVGTEKRLELIARDLVDHFEQRLEAMEGKAMIVCMSRRICVELYKQIVKLRPAWHDADDDQGAIKIVMTGSADDPLDWQPHIRNKPRREALAKRFKNAQDPFQARDRPRHVADRVRCAVPAHDVCGQADARAWADAGHRPREPRVSRQARRPGRRLPRAGRSAQAGPGQLHRKWRPRARRPSTRKKRSP